MSTNITFRQRLNHYLGKLSPEKVVGASGLAVLCALAILAYDPVAAGTLSPALSQWLGSLSLNVLAGVLQQAYQHEAAQPGRDELARLQRLAQSLEQHVQHQSELRQQMGTFLEKSGALEIAEEVIRGNPAVHGWLLLAVYQDVKQYRADFDQLHEALARLEQLMLALPLAEQEALLPYLQMVTRRMGRLPLGPLDPSGRESTQLFLAQVFVNIDAGRQIVARTPGETKKTEVIEFFRAALGHIHSQPQLILLGDPGSGKSTLLRFLAYWLAKAALEPEGNWREQLKWEHLFTAAQEPAMVGEEARWRDGSERKKIESQTNYWQQDSSIPVWVELRDFARTPFDPRSPLALWQFVAQRLEKEDLGQAISALQAKARRGEVLLLLDGVDEVPAEQRRAVWQAVAALLDGPYGGNRWVATCRKLSFVADEAPTGVPSQTLEPLNAEQISQFVASWYGALHDLGELSQEQTATMTAKLEGAALGERLRPLAQNPMLLTIMALVQTYYGTLPEERARLYQQCVETLLLRWQRHKEGEGQTELPDVLAQLQTTQEVLERLLWEIAWQAHSQAADRAEMADIPEPELVQIARRHLGNSWSRAEQFVAYTEKRAHLLVGRGGVNERVFTFPHRTFQEYLAACYLAAERRFPRRAAELAAQGDTWRELLCLAVGTLMFNRSNREKALDGINEVLPQQEPAPADEAGWRRVWLAAEMAAVVGAAAMKMDEVGQEVLPRLQKQLAALLAHGALPPRQRVAAGAVLGQLGDPRPEVLRVDEMLFCLVPAGPFTMGSADDEPGAYNHEKPQHEVVVPYAYWLGYYPVTQAQFAEFVQAGGYGVARYWKEAQADNYWRHGKAVDWSDKGHSQPPNYGQPYSLPNHPVVGITWYEALAFCRWLSERWQKQLPEHWQVRLPSEAEWEKAARGGWQIPLARVAGTVSSPPQATGWRKNLLRQRLYPWGNDPDENRANSAALAIQATSAVGCFPQGAGPYGHQELSGNVWEWQQSQWQDYPYVADDGREQLTGQGGRVLRGGAWYNDYDALRCAYRFRFGPDNAYDGIGFRLVVSPLTRPTSGL